MRTIAALALALLAVPLASAQTDLAFDQTRHDFGTFDEGEVVRHTFAFVNRGAAALQLTDVEAACGCTTPEWTRQPVAPGDSGRIVVAYDSDGRPGPFEKTVRVSTETEGVTLRISGDVVPVFVARGVRMGALVFATDHVEAQDVPRGERYQAVFRFQNGGDRPVRLLAATAGAPGVEFVFPDRPVFPGDVAAVLVNVPEPARVANGNALRLAVAVETDDADQPTKTLRVDATLAE